MASTSRETQYTIVLGPSLDQAQREGHRTPSLVSVKYNFKPPSIANEAAGFLRCPGGNTAEWILEYGTSGSSSSSSSMQQRQGGEGRQGHEVVSAQGFVGTQTPARDVDCILVWDEHHKTYVLDCLAATMTMKYDRNYTRLSKGAQQALAAQGSTSKPRTPPVQESALGLRLHDTRARSSQTSHTPGEKRHSETSDEEEDFARQLEQGLEEFEQHGNTAIAGIDTEPPRTEAPQSETERERSPKRAKTGLGLTGAGLLQPDGITPRGSPQIDRPSKVSGAAAFAQLNPSGHLAGHTPSTTQLRATPHFSPASATISPRQTPLHESSLSSTWKPPAQRSNVAIAYDDDDDEEDDEDDDDDDDEEEEEEEEEEEDEEDDEEDDDDLESFARKLEGSLQEPNAPAEEAQSKPPPAPAAAEAQQPSQRTRRASARGNR